MKAPVRIYNVSHTQLSIARHFGGIKFNGHCYTYFPADDTLVRDDILEYEGKLEKPNTEQNNWQEAFNL